MAPTGKLTGEKTRLKVKFVPEYQDEIMDDDDDEYSDMYESSEEEDVEEADPPEPIENNSEVVFEDIAAKISANHGKIIHIDKRRVKNT